MLEKSMSYGRQKLLQYIDDDRSIRGNLSVKLTDQLHCLDISEPFISRLQKRGSEFGKVWKFLKLNCPGRCSCVTTNSIVEHGQKITQFFLGEHKVITPEQQYPDVILWVFFYVFRMSVAIAFLCENAVESAISVS